MPFDGLMLAATCTELNEKIINSRIEKIYQPEKNEIHLYISRPGQRMRLVISAHSRDARINLSETKKENPSQPPVFCMVLRKHLEGGFIKKLQQEKLERILKIHISARDELGHPVEKILICEFMGKHSNIILVDPKTNNILDGINRYTHEVSRHREVLPGIPYTPPPSQNKIHPLSMDENTFRNMILDAPLEQKLAKALQAGIDGFSNVMTQEIVYRSGLSSDLEVNYCGEHELRVLWQALETILSSLAKEKFDPVIITDREGNTPIEFAAFDLTRFEKYIRKKGEPSEVLDEFFTLRRELDRIKNEKQSLTTLLNKEIKKMKKKISLQEESAAKAQNADDYRIYGELLTAYFYQLQRGLTEITVTNFYDPEGQEITIPLDSNLTPSENVQAYFKKYTKARNTRDEALKQAQKNKEELEYLQGVLNAVEQATQLTDLVEIREELKEQGYIPVQEKTTATKKEKPAESQPKKYISGDGFTILVGRNNKQNDRLTMKLAKDNDIWVHTQEIAGSHVIIKSEGHEIPENTIHEAAVLAAYHSRGQNSNNVPVDYTYKKNVRKPRGAKPGYVIYDNQRTIYVTPDTELVNSLAQVNP